MALTVQQQTMRARLRAVVLELARPDACADDLLAAWSARSSEEVLDNFERSEAGGDEWFEPFALAVEGPLSHVESVIAARRAQA